MSRPPLFGLPGSASAAGIVVSSHSGERVVASSRRPDGTLRKEVKIRPGFTPEEDVQRYRSSHMTSAKKGIPGLATALTAALGSSAATTAPATSAGGVSVSKSKAQKKNEKRKEKRRGENDEVEVAESSEDEEGGGAVPEEDVPESWDDGEEKEPVKVEPVPVKVIVPVPVAEPVDEGKRVKALQKKLRQAEQLRDKSVAGMYILPEQREKVAGIADLEKELEALMLSSTSTA